MKHGSGMVLAAALALAAGGAGAQETQGIQTPSHNIYCMAIAAADGQPAELRCDVVQAAHRPTRRPRDCDLDWGDAFVLHPGGRGGLMCHGDTVANSSAPELDYGRSWSAYGFTCLSRTGGLTCRNRQGHGFTLSRAAQTLF